MARLSVLELLELAQQNGWETLNEQRASVFGLLYQIATEEQLETIAKVYREQIERDRHRLHLSAVRAVKVYREQIERDRHREP